MTKRTDQELADALNRRRYLRDKRAGDVFALVSRLPKISSKTLGAAVPPLVGPPVMMSKLSARELEWFTQNVTSIRLQESRAAGTIVADLAVTAQFTPNKLTVRYQPRYFLLPETTAQIASVYTYYFAPQATNLPTQKVVQMPM